MYSMTVDKKVFYIEGDGELTVTEAHINIKLNEAGYAEFFITEKNPFYNSFQKRKSVVDLILDENVIWRGEVREIEDDEDGKTIYCVGALSWLTDSIVYAKKFSEDARKIFLELIEQHNGHINTIKRFGIGNVDIPRVNINFAADDEETLKVIRNNYERFKRDLVVTFENNDQIINFINVNTSEISKRPIISKENMINFIKIEGNEEFATVIIPKGKIYDSTTEPPKRVSVTSVNERGLVYMDIPEAIKKYGRIVKTVYFDEIETPKELYDEAKKYIEQMAYENITIEAEAFDIDILNTGSKPISIGQKVRVIVPEKELDMTIPVREMDIYPDDPKRNSIKLSTIRTKKWTDMMKERK